MLSDEPWQISGTYLEACNCDAICPCRTVDGRRGGRSTHGFCTGALSWGIERGHAGPLDVSGLAVGLVFRYSDDDPGSPWTFVLYLDSRADTKQRDALEDIFLGREKRAPSLRFGRRGSSTRTRSDEGGSSCIGSHACGSQALWTTAGP